MGAAGETGAMTQALRAAGAGGAYGFFGSDKSDIPDRLFNAGLGATIGGVAHLGTDALGRLAQSGYRTAARPIESLFVGPEATADKYALNTAARGMPTQSLKDVEAAQVAANQVGVPAPAAASLNRAGQDYLARGSAGSPAARAVADQVASDTRAAIPQQLASDFNSAIEAVAPQGVDTSAYLNRPVRDIASDIQSMAGREYEKGIEPIKGERLELTPEISNALGQEQIPQAVRDALNTKVDPATRGVLRNYLGTIQQGGMPILSVDAARSIATALDRKAAKMADGSPEALQLGDVSAQIRQGITDQFPEFEPVNQLYASRKNAINAMMEARNNFFASTPDQIDALNTSSRRFTDEPNQGEYNGVEQPTGTPLPSNRQLAGAGAREATTVQAGENGIATASRLANNANQQTNNATVLGQQGAQAVAARAGVRANNADVTDRIASGATADKTESWFNLVKQAAVAKVTGGSHLVVARAAASIPGLSSQDAARVVRLYLDSDSAPRVIQSLSSAYGAQRARFIMARMAAVTASDTGVRGFPQRQ
jgi:hypothetical protein